MAFNDVIEKTGMIIDAAGVVVIATGVAIALVVTAVRLSRRESAVYLRLRQQLGQAILLGLELLVAGDIVRTVAASPSLTSVAILAAIVLIRTFLSFSLQVETTVAETRSPGLSAAPVYCAGAGAEVSVCQSPNSFPCGSVQVENQPMAGTGIGSPASPPSSVTRAAPALTSSTAK
jgi:uncharacterized membrane protein